MCLLGDSGIAVREACVEPVWTNGRIGVQILCVCGGICGGGMCGGGNARECFLLIGVDVTALLLLSVEENEFYRHKHRFCSSFLLGDQSKNRFEADLQQRLARLFS